VGAGSAMEEDAVGTLHPSKGSGAEEGDKQVLNAAARDAAEAQPTGYTLATSKVRCPATASVCRQRAEGSAEGGKGCTPWLRMGGLRRANIEETVCLHLVTSATNVPSKPQPCACCWLHDSVRLLSSCLTLTLHITHPYATPTPRTCLVPAPWPMQHSPLSPSPALSSPTAPPPFLGATQVKTPVPFLLKGSLREYQHIGLDWLVTLYKKRLNGILADEMVRGAGRGGEGGEGRGGGGQGRAGQGRAGQGRAGQGRAGGGGWAQG
jgi:hypothetical protein